MKKILLVDHLTSLLEQQKTILNRSDFRIFTARSGEEALTLHKAEKVDLIVADLDMPGMSGDKLCVLLRNEQELKHVSVIIICANTPADLARAKNSGANVCITKPLRPVQFIEKVTQLLDVPERQSYRVLLKVKVKGKAGEDSFFCSSQNISVSGLLIESDKIFLKGDILACSFFLPGSHCIATDAEVMRIVRDGNGSPQYGVRYLNIDPKHRSAIEAFIASKNAK